MRVSVPLKQAYKLINHGPTTLLTSSAEGRANVMAAAWVMSLELEPARICAVVSSDSFTRELLDKSGELVVNIPTVQMAEATFRAGRVNGKDLDKIADGGFGTAPASQVAPPLLEGCVAWLECRVRPEAAMQKNYDLFVLDVLAAWADDEVFSDGEWHFEGHPDKRTLHHVSRGVFLVDGERIDVQRR